MNKDNEDNSKPNQLLYYTGQEGLFDEKLNPNIDNTEKISGGSALFRYFSSDIIVKQFNGFVCSPFCSKIDNNHLIITSRNIDILHDNLTRFQLEIINEMFSNEKNRFYKFCNELIKCFETSSETKYIVFNLSLEFLSSGYPDFRHANLVIIDKSNIKKCKYFIFEPHGYNFSTDIYGNTHIQRKDVSNFLRYFFERLKQIYEVKYPDPDISLHDFTEVIKQYTGIQKEEIANLEKDSYGMPIRLIHNEGLCVTHVLFFAFSFLNFEFGEIRRPETMFDVASTPNKFFKSDKDKHQNTTIEQHIESYEHFMKYTGDDNQWIHKTLIAFNNKLTRYIYTVYLFQFYQYHKTPHIRVTRRQKASKILDTFSDNIFNKSMAPMQTVDIFIAESVKQIIQSAFDDLCKKRYLFTEEEIFTINGINFKLINNKLQEIDNLESLSYSGPPSKRQARGKKLKAKKTEKIKAKKTEKLKAKKREKKTEKLKAKRRERKKNRKK